MLEIISSKNLISSKNDFIKNNKFLAEYKLKRDIKQLPSKYKNGNNIHEHKKQ